MTAVVKRFDELHQDLKHEHGSVTYDSVTYDAAVEESRLRVMSRVRVRIRVG